jgi:hypothetical protein
MRRKGLEPEPAGKRKLAEALAADEARLPCEGAAGDHLISAAPVQELLILPPGLFNLASNAGAQWYHLLRISLWS